MEYFSRFKMGIIIFATLFLVTSTFVQAAPPSIGFGVGARYTFDITRSQSVSQVNDTITERIDNTTSFYQDDKELVVSTVEKQEPHTNVTAVVWTGNVQGPSKFTTNQWVNYLKTSIEYKSRFKTQVEEQGIPIPVSGDFSDGSSATETNLNGENMVQDQISFLPLLTSNDASWVRDTNAELIALAGTLQNYDVDLSAYTTSVNSVSFTNTFFTSQDDFREKYEYNYTSILDFTGTTTDGTQFRYNQVVVALGIVNIEQSFLEFFFDCYGWTFELGGAIKSYIDITSVNGTQTTPGNTSEPANFIPILSGISLIIMAVFIARKRKLLKLK